MSVRQLCIGLNIISQYSTRTRLVCIIEQARPGIGYQNIKLHSRKSRIFYLLPFDPNLDTILLTDASRLHGIGFALIQIKKGNMRLIEFASSCLTPTHQRYGVCKLECMAVQWAIKKSDFYFRGLPYFEIWTDHKPLVGIFSKGSKQLGHS